MRSPHLHTPRPRSCVRAALRVASGITLIEVLIATAVLGVLGVAALQASSSSALLRRATAEHLAMARRCEATLDTALALPYDDLLVGDAEEVVSPGGTVLGAGSVRSVSGSRAGDASEITTTKRILITYVDPDDPASEVSSDLGLKRILVQITRAGRTIASVHALRSRAADEALP